MKRTAMSARTSYMPRSKIARTAGARHVRVLTSSKLQPPALRAELDAIDWTAHKRNVLGMWCLAQAIPGHRCSGPLIPHHAGLHGTGIKSLEAELIPLCDGAHRDLHDHVGTSGTFATFTKETARAQENQWVRFVQQYCGIPLTV